MKTYHCVSDISDNLSKWSGGYRLLKYMNKNRSFECDKRTTCFINNVSLLNYLKLKKAFGIVITDIFNHLIYAFNFCSWNLSVFNISSYQIT